MQHPYHEKDQTANLQELASLGKAHRVVASLQVRILCEHVTNLCHLVIHVHEEAVLHILRNQPREEMKGQIYVNNGHVLGRSRINMALFEERALNSKFHEIKINPAL